MNVYKKLSIIHSIYIYESKFRDNSISLLQELLLKMCKIHSMLQTFIIIKYTV